LVEGDNARAALLASERFISEKELLHMFWFKRVLVATLTEQIGAVDEQELLAAVLGLTPPGDKDAGRKARAVEEVGAEADDRFDGVHIQHLRANLALGAHAEQRSVRQYDRHTTRCWSHRGHHVLDPCPIAVLLRRRPGEVPSPRVMRPRFLTPRR